MNKYTIMNNEIDSIDLKCLVVSRGVKVSKDIYRTYAKTHRIGVNPLMCNCIILSDGTIVQLTDMSFHLKYLTGILSWDNLKLLKYASELETPFSLRIDDGKPALYYKGEFIDHVSFPPKCGFYFQKTSSGLPFMGNAVMQGLDWVAFQCLWPCEYAAAGKPCEFCFSGGDFETLAKKGKPLPIPVNASDAAEIVKYAIEECGCNSIQITGGSTFDHEKEYKYVTSYLEAVNNLIGRENIKGDILLYITPPKDFGIIDEYFTLGADKIACSLELWDENLAKTVTPGKIYITTRGRHLEALQYISERYGAGRAFSNFIIGIEPFETLKEGAVYLAERGIIPTASVWMPMGRPVNGSMQAPGVEYYQKVKDLFAELYQKYNLEPSGARGLNVCIERDIWNYSRI
ncbi:MAG: radical SAM protein [Caldicoprobacterales bacterium]